MKMSLKPAKPSAADRLVHDNIYAQYLGPKNSFVTYILNPNPARFKISKSSKTSARLKRKA